MVLSIEDHEILYRSSLSNITDNNNPSLCQICFEPFKQNIRIPKLLPCGHSFCNDCITALKFNSICICKCPICRHSFPLRYDTKFPTNYSLLDLLDRLQSSFMTKQSDDMALKNEIILPSTTNKSNKLKSSKIPYSSSRLSHLLSKISRKDKKTDNYYISAESPFTSTPDMSGEEDGVEVSYVETESENNGDSENTIPAADSANVKSTPSRMIYVDSAVLDDSTTTTTASQDYSSSSASGNMNNEEQMTRTNIITCTESKEQVIQPTTKTIVATKVNTNSRNFLKKIWCITTISIQLFLVIFILFWSLIIIKIFYDDYHSIPPKQSMLCGTAEIIKEWLSLDLTQMIQCNHYYSSTFLERLQHEAEISITFLIAQLRFISTIWSSLTFASFTQLYNDWLHEVVQKVKEIFNEYYKTIWTNYLRKYYDMILISN